MMQPASSDDNNLMQNKPQAAFIGVPALYHGAYNDPKADVELQLAKVILF